MTAHACPQCGDLAAFSKKRGRYYCAECELEFDHPIQAIEPQAIFLSYAHRSEREEDFDVSEELVLLIQEELQRDGHTVWIDKEGIRAGSQWRERITAAILGHAHFLLFLSTRSVRDPGVCLNEIAIALGHGKNIQTVLTQDERRVTPPLTISHIQWHDFQHWREIRADTKTGPMGENWDTWFSHRMAGVRETLTSARNARVSGELQKLRDILDPRSFEARIVEKTANFHGRKWLFDAAQDWLDNSTSRMFWLKGSPGVGKSAFAAKLAHQARSAVIGFFMCDFQGRKDPEESACEAICTLAFQIASRLPDYRLKLLYEKQLDKDKVNNRTADDLFEFLITEPLNRSGKIPESTRLCLVIDALDEAGRRGKGNALAELLAKHAERLPEWLGVLVTSRPEPYLEQMLKTLSGTAVDGESEQNRQDLADLIDQRLPQELQGDARQQVIELVLEKSGGTFLYLSLVEKDKTLNLADPKNLPDKLDGFFTQTFNRYFPDTEQYGQKTEPFLRLMVAAPGPLPAEMGQEILGWSQRELTLNVIEPMGSLLQEREGGLVFFHASLNDWLKDPRRSGLHCTDEEGIYLLADFLWQDRQRAAQGLALGEDGFTEKWVERSVWIKRLSRPGYSPRFWVNMAHRGAKEVANATNQLAREVEYARRLVSLECEAWGAAHDIFEMAKMEWEELHERLRAGQ
jgi:TIR domain/NACHT domain